MRLRPSVAQEKFGHEKSSDNLDTHSRLIILERRLIDPKYWLYLTGQFESRFNGLVGTVHRVRAACETLGYQRTPNLAACRELLG